MQRLVVAMSKNDLGEATYREQRIYDRHSRWYDITQWPMEAMGLGRLRRRLWEQVQGQRILEVGVGTGRKVPYYPAQSRVVAIDLSPRMLRRAVKRAERLGRQVDFVLADAQCLPFRDGSFDAITATCVFCSVPDPVQGLRELRRVSRQDGSTLLLEHVRAKNPLLGKAMDWMNPLAVRMSGANINRRTVENVKVAGLAVEREDSFMMSIVKMLRAKPVDG
jgi:ubiquinone/menaquinone biosynthesis C-methylase UbiE